MFVIEEWVRNGSVVDAENRRNEFLNCSLTRRINTNENEVNSIPLFPFIYSSLSVTMLSC